MSLLSGLFPKLEGPSLMRRVVTFHSGRSPGLRVNLLGPPLPIEIPTVGSGLQPRLQWRYHGGFSPPSLFSLGGHLNGQWLYIFAEADDMPPIGGCQGLHHRDRYARRTENFRARPVSPLAGRCSLSEYRQVVNRVGHIAKQPSMSLFRCLESSEAGQFAHGSLPPVF